MPLLIFVALMVFAPGLLFFLLHLGQAVVDNPVVQTVVLTGLVLAVLLSVWRERLRRKL